MKTKQSLQNLVTESKTVTEQAWQESMQSHRGQLVENRAKWREERCRKKHHLEKDIMNM